ncbi:MAG TPA: CHAD domain-containing protein [Microlunatus sp.]|nr:CHAD domain-containing protein [Microlunatus sp.]
MTNEPATLRDLVGAYVRDQITVLLGAAEQLQAREHVVHATRVAVRRLRSTLRVFGDLFDVPKAGQLEDELVWWASILGVVRDLDILEARLEGAIAALPPELVVGPVSSALQREIGARRKAGWEDIDAAIGTDRYRALTDILRAWQAEIPFTPAAGRPAKKVKSYVERADRKVLKRLKASGKAYAAGDPSAPALAHAARKAGKRHRYAAELAEPLWGKKASRIVSHRKNLQDVLGGHQDAVVSEAFLRELGIRIGARRDHNGFTWGILYAQERAELARLPELLEPFLP